MSANEQLKHDANIAPLIHCIRGVRVILDADLAMLCEMETRRLNEQLRPNVDRFPEDFAFQLAAQEWAALRAQIAALIPQHAASQHTVQNRSHFATSSRLCRGAAYRLWAFTEHGALQRGHALVIPKESEQASEAGDFELITWRVVKDGNMV